MTKKSLMVLLICLAIGAGVAGTIWAYCCCTNSCLCHGGHVQVLDTCLFGFHVDHDRDCGTDHEVSVYLRPDEGQDFTAFMMTPPGPPYLPCMPYTTTLQLNANTTYWYYFKCPACGQNTQVHYFNTGDCD